MVKRKVLGARDEDAKEKFLEVNKEERERLKGAFIKVRSRGKNSLEGRCMNQDVNGNRKLLWKEVSKANGGKVKNSNRIKDGNGRLALEEAEVRRIWKEYCEDLYNVDTQEQVAVHLCGFEGVQRGNYFGGEPIRRTDI